MRHLKSGVAAHMGFNPARWIRDSRRMRSLIRSAPPPLRPSMQGSHFAVVVTPWLATAVPWYAIGCGLLLAASGCQVTFVIDDLPFGSHALRHRFIVRCIRFVMDAMPAGPGLVTISRLAGKGPASGAVDTATAAAVRRLAELNAVWTLRGESIETGRDAYIERAVAQLTRTWVAVGRALRQQSWDAVLVPGGVYGSSGVWVEHCRQAGVRVCSYDSGGPGVTLLCADGIACQLQDIPRAFAALKQAGECEDTTRLIREAATAEMSRRRAGTDRFASQVTGSDGVDSRLEGAVLIALNSSWDSAALGLHEIFDSSSQWLIETVRYILENSNTPVVVRQHPAERSEAARTTDDYRKLLHERFGDHPRLHFIAAGERVNSYALLERVGPVVVYTSTIGTEAAMGGKVVITPSRSYYSDLGFVWKARTREEYYRHLENAIAGEYAVTARMREDAMLCYYLTQCCNWVHSSFSPEGFDEWSGLSLEGLLRLPAVPMILDSLIRNLPIALLNHRAAQLRQAEVA